MNIGFFSELLLMGTWFVYLETEPPSAVEWMYYAACGAFVLVLIGFILSLFTGRISLPKDKYEDE